MVHNSETIGYLEAADQISLPVVQRLNDNEYYLSHNFDGDESSAGTLFLDGVNRVYPRDSVLIIYGHNMKSGDMFAKLTLFNNKRYLCGHPIVYFDTIYENGAYVPFAAFNATMTPASSKYFDLRRFGMDAAAFQQYIAEINARSLVSVPIDVQYGDDVLLLVTCSYNTNDERFILALRRLREDETEESITALLQTVVPSR